MYIYHHFHSLMENAACTGKHKEIHVKKKLETAFAYSAICTVYKQFVSNLLKNFHVVHTCHGKESD